MRWLGKLVEAFKRGKCEYCDSHYTARMSNGDLGSFWICYDCLKKVFDKVLREEEE